ncbi:MAG TPA: peptidyl-prolyl cis-trans isomerase [Acidobacteriaceae bacterium]|nr:peptidyl-prolyl cis-trans isomerase [Acidobacteriaceae bacterium]
MIRFLQKDTKFVKVLFWIIISVSCIAMVIFLVPGLFSGQTSTTDTYATIGYGGILGRFLPATDTISMTDVQRLAQSVLQRQGLPDTLMPFILPRVGQGLIQQHIELIEAKHLGITATDQDVRNFLHSGEWGMLFFPGGNFIGDQKYTQFVADQFGMTTQKFESEIKEEIIEDRLRALITGGVTVSDNDVRTAYIAQATKIKFDYAVIDSDALRNEINPTDAELEVYFKRNAAKYAQAIPEQRKIEYVAFTASDLPQAPAPVTEPDIEQYYEQHLSDYQLPEQVKVRHILIAVNSQDPKADAAAKAKALSILDQLHHGANFADLAKKYSDDPGSKSQGGELGWIKHGVTVPNFDKVAFSLQPGQTSGLVRTRYGYHIIQVEAKQAAHTQPIDEVKPQIMATLTRQHETQAEQAFAHQLSAESAKSGLAATAAAHHLKLVTTDLLSQSSIVPDVADGSQMLAGAFSAQKNGPPQVASTGDGFAVYQVTAISPAHAPDFASYKSHILDDYRNELLPQLLATKANELADRAKTDGDLAKAAKEMGAKMETSDLVGHDAQVPDIGALSTVAPQLFDLNPGQLSGPINTGHTGVVARLIDKQLPTSDEITKNFDATRDTLLSQRRSAMFDVFVSNLQNIYLKDGRIRISRKLQQGALGGGSPS